MEQQFVLKYHGGIDYFECANMSAEERRWMIERIQKEVKKQNEQIHGSAPKGRFSNH